VRARGCLVGVLGVAAGLALLGQAADVGARHLATDKIETRARQVVPESSGVHAWIRSFPFLKVGINGHVDEIGLRAARVVEKPLVFTDVIVDLKGVRVSVSQVATSAQIDVTHVDRGTITMTVLETGLAQALPASAAGSLGTAALAGAKVSVNATTRHLVVALPGVASVALPLPKADLLPCTPAVTQLADRITLSCTFTQVPSAFTSS
jgi:hypothetical protein